MANLHVILGPTGVGKTALATSMARRTGAPVVVLDRIQCHPEIAIASGRPAPSEVAGTRRIYLEERSVGAGEMSAAEGLSRLEGVLAALTQAGHELVIVEGGSVSLCGLWRNKGLFDQRAVQVLEVEDHRHHWGRVLKRVREMVLPGEEGESIVDEFSRCWQRYKEQRSFLSSVCGFNAIAEWCRRAGFAPEEVSSRRLDPGQRGQLVTEITSAHCAYARVQSDFFVDMRQRIHV